MLELFVAGSQTGFFLAKSAEIVMEMPIMNR